MNTEIKRNEIVAEALTWVGTPYHHMGKVKGGGVDCIQILIGVYHNVGLIEDIDTGHYAMDWALHRSEERYLMGLLQYAHETKTPKKGDIVVYKFGRCVSHAGILIDDDMIVHAWLRSGIVSISNINESELNGRACGFYTLFKDN